MTRPARPVVGVAVIEASTPLHSFDFSTADRWHVLVLAHGVPAARLDLPSPGAVESAELARALLLRHADEALRRGALAERLLERLGGARGRPGAAPVEVSAVVCTHGRPDYLPTVLEALARLDPPADEIVIVDNAPGERDCRAEVEAIGARYVREDRKGLDHARNAGIRAATCDVVAFTDDDCVPPPGWIGALRRAFEDPIVSGVTGPAFPYVLDTPGRVRMERQASLTRGIQRRHYDWTVLSPMHGSQVGVGANMAFRRTVLDGFDGPFAVELDAGTATLSGGDSHMFSRLLAAGHRIVYEPAVFVFHQHRPRWGQVVDAVLGYGTGAAAAATKLLVEQGELEAPRVWRWLVHQYVHTQLRRAVGRADAAEARVAWSYLRGGIAGPAAWRRALADAGSGNGAQPRHQPPETAADEAGLRPAPLPRGRAVALSAIVPTVGRSDALRRCLAALSRQTVPSSDFEVIVCDDTPRDAAAARIEAPAGLALTIVPTYGVGAGAARNAGARIAQGRVLLFLDDDLVAAPDLVERHLVAQRAVNARAVVGHSPPQPVGGGLAASGAALWWKQHFDTLSTGKALGFVDMLSGNMSLPRSVFETLGGFDESFSRHRREDWELGLRLRRRGIPIVYDGSARAAHEFRLDAAARLRACLGEGHGDARLVAIEPAVAAYLPLAHHRPPTWRTPLRAIGFRLLAADRARRPLVATLRVLEAGRLRSLWSRIYNRAQRATYARGLREGGWRPANGATPPSIELELASSTPIKAPEAAVTPRLALLANGQPCGELTLPDGRWHPSAAQLIATELPTAHLAALDAGDRAAEPGPGAGGGPPPPGIVLVGDFDPAASDVAEGEATVVSVASSRDGGLWARVATELHRPDTRYVAVALPGRRPSSRWLHEAMLAFEGPRIGAVVGRALPSAAPAEPLYLTDRGSRKLPFTPLGPGVDFVVLRSEAFDGVLPPPALATVNDLASVGWWVESALQRDWLVAHGGVHGMEAPRRPAATRQADKLAAWAALYAASERSARPNLMAVAGAALMTGRRVLADWSPARR